MFYLKTLLFGLALFGLSYFYTSAQQIPNVLNKSVADTSILLIGLSMLLTSVCYFWNRFDALIVYRKYLGLIGVAFALAHVALSYTALQRLFLLSTWQEHTYWPILTGALAAVIFGFMTLISNQRAAKFFGGKLWKMLLQGGYVAVLFVLAHVVLLKSARWITWYNGGMQTLPSMSMLVSVFMIIVVVMRVALWWSLTMKAKKQS